MNIECRKVGKYASVEIQEGSNTIDLGLLNEKERIDLAFLFIQQAESLSRGLVSEKVERLFDKLVDSF